MKFMVCKECSKEFLFPRISCPKCGSESIESSEISEGEVVEVVSLIATPEPFPDQYSLVLFKTDAGTPGFCRSTDQVSIGDRIAIEQDEYGPLCKKK